MTDLGIPQPRQPAWYLAALLAILLLGLSLRGYRLTGWILDNDESHFLIHALRPSLLVTTQYPSYARPDCFYVLLLIPTIKLFGANELAARLWPVLFGTLSILAVARLVRQLTGGHRSALWAALLLAVLPLHVFLSCKAEPDVIAVFFLLCALIQLIHLSRPGADSRNAILLGTAMALAIWTKLTALGLWLSVLLCLPLIIRPTRECRRAYAALFLALLPVTVMVLLAKSNGSPIHFFEEEKTRAAFGLDPDRLLAQLGLVWRFYAGAAALAALGALMVVRKRRELLPLMLPLGMTTAGLVLVVPYFRSQARDLTFLVPTLWPLIGFATAFFPSAVLRALAGGALVAAQLVLTLIGTPDFHYNAASYSGRSTALLDRPAGWPSHAISAWLPAQVAPDEELLITGLSYTDPLVLTLGAHGVRYQSAPSAWERLRQPENKIKYVVFVDDPTVYAPGLARFARTHFHLVQSPAFVGYSLFDCRQNGQFVAYPDARNSADSYTDRGVRLARARDFLGAIPCFLTALQEQPARLDIKKLLLTCYLSTAQRTKALPLAREIVAADPHDPDSNLNLAVLYHELGMLHDAQIQCRRNIELGIAPASSYGILAQTLEQDDQFAAASAAYQRSLQHEPGNPVTLELVRQFYARHPKLVPSPTNRPPTLVTK